MASQGKRRGSAVRHTDRFEIESGALGPVPQCRLDIRPLTVFIGGQGTGKSLVAQLLYALEELPFLMVYAREERGARKRADEFLFRSVLDRLRSRDRAFATFANHKVHVVWKRSDRGEWPDGVSRAWAFRAFRANRVINLVAESRESLAVLRKASRVLHRAVFIPTERIVYSQLRSAMSKDFSSLPLTYSLFDEWLVKYGQAGEWAVVEDEQTRGDIALVDGAGRRALGGRARMHGDRWMWEYQAGKSRGSFDLDLASSGQKANWALPYLGRAMLALRGMDDLAENPTLFVEEPEIHLHPAAQREMINLLALLINRGFRVVVTTHSLTVLYTLNNLLQAWKIKGAGGDDLPLPDFRLEPTSVSVYAFRAGKEPRQLVDIGQAFIDERELGRVSDELSEELNRIGSRLTGQER